MNKMSRRLRAPRREKGAIGVQVALFLFTLLGAAAMTINVSRVGCVSPAGSAPGHCSHADTSTVAASYPLQGLDPGAATSPFPASFQNALTVTSSTMMRCE
ncbi:MAG TPA: hypothetical protein VIH96_17135 [Paraburkholderia sp.]|jgi:hypothetical protein